MAELTIDEHYAGRGNGSPTETSRRGYVQWEISAWFAISFLSRVPIVWG